MKRLFTLLAMLMLPLGNAHAAELFATVESLSGRALGIRPGRAAQPRVHPAKNARKLHKATP